MSLSANAVMEIRKCSRAKGSSWLLIGSWIEVTVTSRFLSPPGERSSRDLMLSSPVTPNLRFQEYLKFPHDACVGGKRHPPRDKGEQWSTSSSVVSSPVFLFVDQEILRRLEKDKILVFTPSRRVQGRRVVCYDDRFIVKLAYESDGIIVSNDNYRDLANEKPEWKKFIDERLLMYSFVNDK